jgi:putative flippase GtrA
MISLTPSGRDGARIPLLRHYGGFVMGGGMAFLTDVGILNLLTIYAGLSPFIARLVSIATAMVVSWLMHRTVTFHASTRPSLKEFGQFAAVAWSAQAVNYVVFSIVLFFVPTIGETLAAFIGSGVAMFFSYTGFRFGVFARRTAGNRPAA